jgi:hypothetical protein
VKLIRTYHPVEEKMSKRGVRLRTQDALQGEFDIVCGHLDFVVKHHIFPQIEAVNPSIVGSVPILGQRRFGVHAVIQSHQAIEQLFRQKDVGIGLYGIELVLESVSESTKTEDIIRIQAIDDDIIRGPRQHESDRYADEKDV